MILFSPHGCLLYADVFLWRELLGAEAVRGCGGRSGIRGVGIFSCARGGRVWCTAYRMWCEAVSGVLRVEAVFWSRIFWCGCFVAASKRLVYGLKRGMVCAGRGECGEGRDG